MTSNSNNTLKPAMDATSTLPDVLWWGLGNTTSVADFIDLRSIVSFGMTATPKRHMATDAGLLSFCARAQLRSVISDALTVHTVTSEEAGAGEAEAATSTSTSTQVQVVPVSRADLAAVAAARVVLQRAMGATEVEAAALRADAALRVHRMAKEEVKSVKFTPEGMFKLLIEGADPDMAADGATALHWAVASNRSDLAAMLLGAGASPLARDLEGRVPLDYRVYRPTKRDFAVGDEVAQRGVPCLSVLSAYLGAENTKAQLEDATTSSYRGYGRKGELLASQ